MTNDQRLPSLLTALSWAFASVAMAAPPLTVPEPTSGGGEAEGVVKVASVTYAGSKSSQCFSDHFLTKAQQASAITTDGRFHPVKLEDEALFEYPMIVMTGEGEFTLSERERENLRQYLERGGFLLASAGCSSVPWNRSFRREIATIAPEQRMQPISDDHPIFHLVFEIRELEAKHGVPSPLEGLEFGGRLSVLYSGDGLNDTAHVDGCCCCGGNEIQNAAEINVNVLTYALLF